MPCECSIVGLLSINYGGIISASINGSTTVEIADTDGTVLLGPTTNTLTLSAYAFEPGGDFFLGCTCPASAQAQIQWIQKYDCYNDITYFIPKVNSKASISGGPINGCVLECDPDIESMSFDANASSGPATPYLTAIRKDGFNLKYTGRPIAISSASPQPYYIQLGDFGTLKVYLQSFQLTISPPQPATVNYSFVFI